MPNVSAPSLRRHASGQWMTLWNGKARYLGKDAVEAQRRYAEELQAWGRWRAEKAVQAEPIAAAVPFVVAKAATPQRVSTATVDEVAKKLLATMEAEVKPITYRASAQRIGLFTAEFGKRPLSSLTPDDLSGWRTDLIKQGYAPNYINPTIVVARRMLTLAHETGMIEVPIRMGVLKGVPIGAAPDKSWTPEQVSKLIALVAEYKPNLARMLLLQFWASMRPSEVGRLTFRRGKWHKKVEGCFVLDESKTEKKTGEKRVVVLTPAALALLERTTPECETFGALCQAVKKVCEKAGDKRVKAIVGEKHFTPHPFRHSAQTALTEAEVTGELVECAAGRVLPRALRVYKPLPLAATRKALEVLGTLVPLPKGI